MGRPSTPSASARSSASTSTRPRAHGCARGTPCVTIGKWVHVAPLGDLPAALALADDEAGSGLLLTLAEANAALEASLARAEARVRELEALLRSKG